MEDRQAEIPTAEKSGGITHLPSPPCLSPSFPPHHGALVRSYHVDDIEKHVCRREATESKWSKGRSSIYRVRLRLRGGVGLFVTRCGFDFISFHSTLFRRRRWLDREFLQLYIGILGNFYVTAAPRSGASIAGEGGGGSRQYFKNVGERERAASTRPAGTSDIQ